MEVIVHHPNTEKGTQELAKRTAQLHAEAATRYIENLACPKEQKEALFAALLKKKKNN